MRECRIKLTEDMRSFDVSSIVKAEELLLDPV
jgi:hypothetical protein